MNKLKRQIKSNTNKVKKIQKIAFLQIPKKAQKNTHPQATEKKEKWEKKKIIKPEIINHEKKN